MNTSLKTQFGTQSEIKFFEFDDEGVKNVQVPELSPTLSQFRTLSECFV